jgi:hypothetical protein
MKISRRAARTNKVRFEYENTENMSANIRDSRSDEHLGLNA